MEGTEGKLCSRLADGLRRNHTYGLALLYHTAGSQVAAITLHTYALLALAGEHRTDLDALDGRLLYLACLGLGNLLAGSNNHLSGSRIDDVVHGDTAQDTLIERRYHLIAILKGRTYQSSQRTTILLGNDHIV